jgi:outer membrane protein assembly factor BamD
MRFSSLFLFMAFLVSSCSKFSKVQKSNDYEYKTRMADKYYVEKKYNYAVQLYEELFPLVKETPQFPDLVYKYAYSAFYLKDYLNAENLFKQFSDLFPNNPKTEEMEYMHAYVFYKQSPKAQLDQTNTQKAIGQMQTFISTHPNSTRLKDANDIIDKCRAKLETKEYESAMLYYNMGHNYFRAAAISFTSLMNDFPDSQKSDEYKFMVIKSYYSFAQNSIEEKKVERYEQVITECNDFSDRFSDSKLVKDVEHYVTLSKDNIKAINNEQTKATN